MVVYPTVIGAIAAAVALSFAIPPLLRRARIDALAMLPFAREHGVELPAGDVLLYVSGPLGKTGLGRLTCELVDGTGVPMLSSPIVVRSRRSTLAGRVTVPLRRFRIVAAGAYRLRIGGIAADLDFSDCALMFARPQGASLAFTIIAVVLLAVALVVCTVLTVVPSVSPDAAAAEPSPSRTASSAVTPPRGGAERQALLQAVRTRAGLANSRNRIRVHHLKVSGRWAYFAGNEIAHVERGEWQETDLSIEALLERNASGWRVVEYWSLPTEARYPRSDFERRVRERRERAGITPAIFPEAP